MGGDDKLAVEIGGRPLLAWTLAALAAAPEVVRIVVVTTKDRRAAVAAAPWLPAPVVDEKFGASSLGTFGGADHARPGGRSSSRSSGTL